MLPGKNLSVILTSSMAFWFIFQMVWGNGIGLFVVLCVQMPKESHSSVSNVGHGALARGSGQPLVPLCEPNVEIPDDLKQCGSCNNRCGTKTNPDDLKSPVRSHTCSCDEFCGFHGDCCQDFETFCPDHYDKYLESALLHPFTHKYDDFKCVSLTAGFLTQINTLMIHTCLIDGSECEFTSKLNEDVNTFVPMYDIHRGVHYISGYCAVCNGAKQVIPWGVILNCESLEEENEYVNSGLVNSTETLADITKVGQCTLEYSLSGESRNCTHNVVSGCKESCRNLNLVSLCENGAQDLTLYKEGQFLHTPTDGIYRNPYCALCNGQGNSSTSGMNCGMHFPSDNVDGVVSSPANPGSFSLTLVFDFDPRKGLTVGEHPPPECTMGEVYVPDEDTCRPITCPSGFLLDGSDCIPESYNITAIVTGTFSVKPTIQMIDKVYQDQSHLERSVQEDVSGTMDSFGISHLGLEINAEINYDRNSLKVSSKIRCNCDYTPLFLAEDNNNDQVQKFERSLASKVRKDVIKYLFQNNLRLESVQAYVTSQLSNMSSLGGQQVDCTWLVYQPNETESGNGTITVVSTGKIYTSGMYEVLDEAVIVCETDLVNPVEVVEAVDVALSIITLVCVGISIVCLIIRVILQFFIASFRSRPGRIQLHMTIALLLAFILLIIGPFLSDIPDACTISAILMAYGFLADFTWMNVIAVDTWLVFRPSSAFTRSDDDKSSLKKHYILGWGIPALLVALSIGMNYSDIDERFQPGFGGSRCWYTQRYAMLIYFGIPIGLSILLNIVLYVHTSFNLHKAFKNARSAIKAENYHFAVYVKLFILMGITWIFGFISAFAYQIVVDFIFVTLTSLQGLFLFISFVCNKRVLTEIRKSVKSETSITLSDRRTTSTLVPSRDSHSKSESVV